MFKRYQFWLAKFSRDRSGSTAVEFAMIAGPFFALIFAVIESTMIFFASATLENGVLEVSRFIRTGQAQAGEMSAGQFHAELCARVDMMLDCDALTVDIQTFENFGSVAFLNPIDGGGNFSVNPQFQMGDAGEIVLIRAFYEWDVFTPGVGFVMANMSNGEQRLLQASTAFRNEPFGSILGP